MAVKISEEQKILRSRYMEIIREYWSSPSMVKYEEKNIGTIVALDNDDLLVIDKPRIETSFCFGYGMCLVSSEDDRKAAESMLKKARTDSSYFIEKNLAPLNKWIDDLQNSRWIWGKRTKYNAQKNPHLVSIEAYDAYSEENSALTPLTEGEIQSIIAGYEEIKVQFTKRLNTYLKRYGLSKLNTWTYLVD